MNNEQSSIERFGELLIRLGALTQKEVDEILEKQKTQPDKRFGAIAVELGVVTSHQIDALLETRTIE